MYRALWLWLKASWLIRRYPRKQRMALWAIGRRSEHAGRQPGG
jgi:hypothetical protein